MKISLKHKKLLKKLGFDRSAKGINRKAGRGSLLKKLDIYIIKQFLGTYFFSIFLIISVAVVFDVNEKISYFLQPEVTLHDIIFKYYLNFIPYYANLFSPLFTFIAVIFFTSNLAAKSEIIAMLSTGTSFKRLLRPYMISAAFLALLTFLLNSFIIPPSSKIMMDYTNQHLRKKSHKVTYAESVQLEIKKDVFVYLGSYAEDVNQGYQFSLEQFKGNSLKSRLTAETVEYVNKGKWKLNNWVEMNFKNNREYVTTGSERDTLIHLEPSDFLIGQDDAQTMTTPQLYSYIAKQKDRGLGSAKLFEIELHKRIAAIMTAFILTVIGASLSAKKKKNGTGLNIAVGLGLSFGYILFMTMTSTFAAAGTMSPWFAAWLPNFIFIVVAIFVYKKAPR